MQVSTKWLRDYIDIKLSVDELAEKFTMAGIPVENIIRIGRGLENVITGRIDKLIEHPNSDHLKICHVNIGKEHLLQIITGASNVQEGQIVPVALIGAQLPNGKKISKSKMRGFSSNGMLCSAEELKLSLENLPVEQQTGIYILPSFTAVGIPVSKVLELDEDILEFELTANRGDCFSVIGLVRELVALTGEKARWPDVKVNEDDKIMTSDMIEIGIEDAKLCSRFSARVLTDIKITKSPSWMIKRLESSGMRSINNIVDATNFVMLELGQPLHAYDYDKIAGHKLTARQAIKGELLHTLDDTNRLAKGYEIVISDAEKAAGLAGIMGGFETEVTENTKIVVLEAASFNSTSIRRTSRAVGIHSEASGRFERGVNDCGTIFALNRVAQLLQEMGACKVCKGIFDIYPTPKIKTKIRFTVSQINKRLGTFFKEEEISNVLTTLGFEVKRFEEFYEAIVPEWRNDILNPEDLSEEVARILGFDKIPSKLPKSNQYGQQSDIQNFVDKIKEILSGLGLCEEISFIFTNEKLFDKLRIPIDSKLRQVIRILNPLTEETPVIRTTLITSILENALRNFNHKNRDVRLFEIAPVFLPKSLPISEQPIEELELIGLLTGRREPKGWSQSSSLIDFYDAKGVVEKLLARLSIINYVVDAGEHYSLHPGKTAVFKKGRETLAVVGELHPDVSEAFEFKRKIFLFSANIITLKKNVTKRFSFKSQPKYPSIERDLALLIDHEVAAIDVENIILRNGGRFLKEIMLFDVYTGEQIDKTKKSLAFSLRFCSEERTLKEEEVDEAFENIVLAVGKSFKATLRD